ncbi:protein phosphatase 2C domain-containing protein [Frankia sp. AgB1.9]|uniref:protein phosphatase 2C domain-containing protein n=2 Tax=Frankia TaxID=1854 RepID=UPI0019333B24|nr:MULTISPECIES: protein phosphatase 2C domain-containing protein [unclassified Frankia]MBL7549876.1 protein phosphatase 2C domain-containing protein [Frankia sp. AgB1.9]MBL7623008.1 protein phosphatase 2C domain-containing protein [Frankia sp. AgB1.8]
MLLLGPDHPALGEVALGGLSVEGDGGPAMLGAALSAGWRPKAVPAVEPNEDGALLAVGPAGALLAVADGHNGSAASTAALRALAARAPALLAHRAGDEAELAAAFAAAAHGAVARPPAPGGAVPAAAMAPGGEPRPARTALSLVVVTAAAFAAVGYGDTTAAVVRRGRLHLLDEPSEFLGPTSPADPFAGHPVTRRRRGPGDLLVVVSDGVPDYLGRAFGAAIEAASRAGADGGQPDAARATARSLIARAGAAGAGDNLTAAVLLAARPRRTFGWF